MATIEFEGTIESARGGGACIPVPFDPSEVFGTRKSVRVIATYDGFQARSNVVTMEGRAVLGVHKATREAIGKDAGDPVRVTLTPDSSVRTVDMPAELAAALAERPPLRTRFDALAFTYRKEFAAWIRSAKRADTRERRLARTLEMLENGETL